jgi:5'-3' exonuclease
MSKTLLIDANAIGRAANHATKLTANGMETQAIFGFLKTMKVLRTRMATYTPLVLWDGKADWRYKLYPEYKQSRKTDPKKAAAREAYKKQVPMIEVALRHLGVRQLTVANMEADDLGGYFAVKLSADPANSVGLITGDEDWRQLVRGGAGAGNVWWRDMRDDSKFVDHKTFYDKTGCKSPFQFLESKILQGDTSDEIGGVGGLGETYATELLAQFGSVRNFWRMVDSGEFKPKYVRHKTLASPEGRTLYKRNFQLMQLLRVDPPKKELTNLDPGKFDKEAFANICEELSFISILKNLDEFTALFQQ